MTDAPRILITGPTGTVGGPLLDLMTGRGAPVLAEPAPHAGAAYTLTGPAALDHHRVASIPSAELGRALVYEPPGRYLHDHRRCWVP